MADQRGLAAPRNPVTMVAGILVVISTPLGVPRLKFPPEKADQRAGERPGNRLHRKRRRGEFRGQFRRSRAFRRRGPRRAENVGRQAAPRQAR